MTSPNAIENPFAHVDIARLDGRLPALLDEAEGSDPTSASTLSTRERRLFRLGVLSGLGEWELAVQLLGSAASEGLLAGSDVQRVAAEAGLIKGLPAVSHFAPALAALGLKGPATVAEAVSLARARPAPGQGGLSEREVFALGLGITWGARCWDT